MSRDLDSVVADAVRGGFVVESRSATAVVVKRQQTSPALVLGRLAVILFFTVFGIALGALAPVAYVFLLIPLAVVVLWVVAARQPPARYRLTVDTNGDRFANGSETPLPKTSEI